MLPVPGHEKPARKTLRLDVTPRRPTAAERKPTNWKDKRRRQIPTPKEKVESAANAPTAIVPTANSPAIVLTANAPTAIVRFNRSLG